MDFLKKGAHAFSETFHQTTLERHSGCTPKSSCERHDFATCVLGSVISERSHRPRPIETTSQSPSAPKTLTAPSPRGRSIGIARFPSSPGARQPIARDVTEIDESMACIGRPPCLKTSTPPDISDVWFAGDRFLNC